MLSQYTFSLRLAIHQLTLRERVLALLAIVAVTLTISYLILRLTGLHNHDDINAKIERQTVLAEQYAKSLEDLIAMRNNPAVISLVNNNAFLQSDITKMKDGINEISEQLMSPESMINLLRELLNDQPELTLIRFDVKPVIAVKSTVDDKIISYRHELVLTLEGEYESLAKYLAKIEAFPSLILWKSLVIKTDNFPSLNIQLEVETHSLVEEWLNV